MKRCDKCTYWLANEQWNDDDLPEDERRGGCHRHAPSPLVGDVAFEILSHLTRLAWEVEKREKEYERWEEATLEQCIWPITAGSDWCGDFQSRAVISDVP